MINDKSLQLSADQTLTAVGASTDYLDLGSDRDIGPGAQLWLVCLVKTAITGTLSVAVRTDDNSSFSSPTTLITSPTLSAPAAGTQIVLPFPFENERYVQAYYGGAPTAGAVDCFITSQPPPNWQAYPDAI